MNRPSPRPFRDWLGVIGWMIVIFLLSSIPGDELPDVGIPNIDKFAHLVEYLILGGLLRKAFSHSFPDMALRNIIIFSVTAAILYAITDEWHQYFVSSRIADPADFVFDIIGSGVGIFLHEKNIWP